MIGTPALSWRRMGVLVRQIAADPTSNLARARAGDLVDWPLPVQLAAITANAVRLLAWSKTEDAHSKTPKNYPEPIRPPIDRTDAEVSTVSTGQLIAFRRRTEYERRSD